jgi:MoxR-like ATPase
LLAVRRDEIWRITGDRIAIMQVADGTERRIEEAVLAIAAIGDEIWALTKNALVLHRPDASTCVVPFVNPISPGARITPCRVGEPGLVVQDQTDFRIDARGIIALRGSREATIPTPAGEVLRSGRGFVYRTSRREVAVPVPGDLVAGSTLTGGAALGSGAMVGLELRSRNGMHLLVIDLERFGLVTRLRLTDVSQIVWVEDRAQAVLVRDRALTAIDLLRGRHLGTHSADDPIDDAAIDTLARSLVAATRSGFEVIEYARLAGERHAPTNDERDPGTLEPPPVIDEHTTVEAPPSLEPSWVVSNTAPPWMPSDAPLLGLAPRNDPPRLDDEDLRAYLEDSFALVAAWCELTAAFDERDSAPEALVAARTRERTAAKQLDRWRGTPTPFAVLGAELELTPLACAILLITAAPQLWSEVATAYRGLATEPGCALLDERLLGRLLEVDRAHRHDLTRELDDDAPLRRHGLIELSPGLRPFAALSVPRVVLRRLTGDRFDGAHEQPTPVPCTRPLVELHVPRASIERALAALATSVEPARVVIRGRNGSGRRTIAAALAQRAGRTMGLVDLAPGARGAESLRSDLLEAHLRGWIPCISLDDVADVAIRDVVGRTIERHPGPLFVRCAPEATPPVGTNRIVIDIPKPSVTERAAIWTETFAAGDAACSRELAERYPIGAGRIVRIASQLARHDGSLDDVDRLLTHERAERLGRVANRVERLAAFEDLVLPPEVLDTVHELIARIRLRTTVLETWGMDRVASTGRAVTALFQGGPGTGKTLVAGVIARTLGYELYRVDLSRVTSKWIGETEKNLGEVFDAAEDGRCILLFDEADSLFARRTAVKTSNDRFANLEVNYLLLRLDTFEGVAVLTTNFGTSIDPAFKRRLAVHLQFPFPDEDERERLWRAHLPSTLPRAGDLALGELARTYRMSGGYIRNAALRAAYLAASEGNPLTVDHLRRAAIAEYRDRGSLGASGALE